MELNLLWLLIAALATLAAGALVFTVRRRGREAQDEGDANTAHFQAQLAEIESDLRLDRLTPVEAEAAKAELAREVLKHRSAAKARGKSGKDRQSAWVLVALAFAAPLLALALYAQIGQPGMPSQPLAGRQPPAEITFDEAVAQIEQQLEITPDDIRGWQALAPAYMSAERYVDAEQAFTRILELGGRNAEALTDLAEARLMQNEGAADPETLALLKEAVDLDPASIRARFYLAGEATRTGNWDEAIALWQELIDMAEDDEPWLAIARNGLATAEARGEAPPPNVDPDQLEMIRGMVDQLAARLAQEGGSLEEWTRLVQSHLVLGDIESAAIAYRAAIAAYPDPEGRSALDEMAEQAGISADD